MMGWTADEIANLGTPLGLIYSFAAPMEILRRKPERMALIAAIADAPCDSIWLKIENFGDDATGEKTVAYIEACRDFHSRGLPVIGDHIGGLPGLGVLASGAVGGISHGVTIQQNFKASSWRRPPTKSSGGTARRIYFPQLDMLLKPDSAKALLSVSQRVRARCGCKDTHCCPHGIRDMVDHPARHALYQRASEIESMISTPQAMRTQRYLEERVRRVSDDVAAIAGVSNLSGDLQKSFLKKQSELSRYRQAIAHLGESTLPTSIALVPQRRSDRGGSGR
jgi:hypothetical protein